MNSSLSVMAAEEDRIGGNEVEKLDLPRPHTARITCLHLFPPVSGSKDHKNMYRNGKGVLESTGGSRREEKLREDQELD